MEAQELLKNLQLEAEVGKKILMQDLARTPYIKDYIVPIILNQTVADLCAPIIRRRHQATPNINEQQVECVHYTSINTIVKLLYSSANQEKNYLRLYDSWHFNDPEEGVYFMRQVEGVEGFDIKHLLYNACIKPAYIACFVLGGQDDISDNLLYWRMYGEEGEGCSLKLLVPAERLSKVLYGRDEAKKTGQDLQQLYNDFRPQIQEALSPIIDVFGKESIEAKIDQSFAETLETISFLYKNDNFSYEREVRFVETLDSIKRKGRDIKFDLDPFLPKEKIRHYYEHEDLASDKVLITDCVITIGPTVNDRDNLFFCLKELQQRADLPGPEIRLSQVSYRKT